MSSALALLFLVLVLNGHANFHITSLKQIVFAHTVWKPFLVHCMRILKSRSSHCAELLLLSLHLVPYPHRAVKTAKNFNRQRDSVAPSSTDQHVA